MRNSDSSPAGANPCVRPLFLFLFYVLFFLRRGAVPAPLIFGIDLFGRGNSASTEFLGQTRGSCLLQFILHQCLFAFNDPTLPCGFRPLLPVLSSLSRHLQKVIRKSVSVLLTGSALCRWLVRMTIFHHATCRAHKKKPFAAAKSFKEKIS